MSSLSDVAYPAASATPVKPGKGILTEVVLLATHWTDRLFRFTSSRDAGFRRHHAKLEQAVSAQSNTWRCALTIVAQHARKLKMTSDTLQTRRLGFGAAGLFALGLASASSTMANAQDYPYCIMPPSRVMGCAFDTMQQCKETASGLARQCLRDPFWDIRTSTNAFAYQSLHSHSKIRR